MNSNFLEQEKVFKDINENKLNMIIKKVIKLEGENVKTNEFNANEMKKKIRKIIEEEVNQCY